MNNTLLLRLFAVIFTFYFTAFILSRIFSISLSDVQSFVASFGIFAPIVYSFILLLGLTVPFNPVSDFLVVNVAALLFAPLVSIIFTFITHSLALTINYHLGKKYGGKIIARITNKKASAFIQRLVDKIDLKTIFILRFFLPTSNIVGVEAISYIAGYEKIPFIKFYLVSIIPWTILSVIYFTSTSLLREKYWSLYFLPAIFLVFVPIIIVLLGKKLKVGKKKDLT